MEFDKIDPDKKAKWAAALRSGDFNQCKGVLVCVDKFCCLGVYIRHIGEFQTYHELGMNASTTPPFPYLKFDKTPYGQVPWRTYMDNEGMDRHTVDYLAAMNDTGTPFSDIADWIEANL